MRLITIPISHYCEKARWALDYAGVGYVEDAHLQLFHYLFALPHNRRGTVPVLVTGSGTLTDSTDILRYLDARLPEDARLYPPALDREVAALEDDFDEHFGVETRRWAYHDLRTMPARAILDFAGQGAPRWERALAPPLFPVLYRIILSRLGASSGNVERGSRVIADTFAAVGARLGDGRRYLCGERFTAADLTFATLAAPVVWPAGYAVPFPPLDGLPASARATIERFRAHPAGEFALRLFRERRWVAFDGSAVPRRGSG